MEYGCNSVVGFKRKTVDMPMKVVLHYRVNGVLRDWVCSYERLNHIIKVCNMKGFDIVGIEDLA